MLHIIKDINDPFISLIKDDSVRPEIPAIDRITNNKEIFVLLDDNTPVAVVCVSYQDFIPTTVTELISSDSPTFAVFYTIWSYKPGSGRRLIFKAKEYIKKNNPSIERFITLSPKTFTASRFHTDNGAKILRVSEENVNYEY